MRRPAPLLLLLVLGAGVLAAGCTARTKRTHPASEAYLHFAAQEACTAAGFRLTRVEEDLIVGERAPLWGLPIGSGGERIRIELHGSARDTRVEIVSEKIFNPFLWQHHFHERVAELLDRFVEENRELADEIEHRDRDREWQR